MINVLHWLFLGVIEWGDSEVGEGVKRYKRGYKISMLWGSSV